MLNPVGDWQVCLAREQEEAHGLAAGKSRHGLASNIPDKTGMQAEGQAEPGHAGDAHSMSSL